MKKKPSKKAAVKTSSGPFPEKLFVISDSSILELSSRQPRGIEVDEKEYIYTLSSTKEGDKLILSIIGLTRLLDREIVADIQEPIL